MAQQNHLEIKLLELDLEEEKQEGNSEPDFCKDSYCVVNFKEAVETPGENVLS